MFTAQAFARTEGYYPSELSTGYFSTKSDVYCYGVVIHEGFMCGFLCMCFFKTITLFVRTGDLHWYEGVFY